MGMIYPKMGLPPAPSHPFIDGFFHEICTIQYLARFVAWVIPSHQVQGEPVQPRDPQAKWRFQAAK